MRAEGLRRFARPYDWDAVDAVIRDEGGAVLEALFPVAEVRRFGGEVDEYLALPARVRQLLGFSAYDGSRDRGGLVGLYENGDPAEWLDL